MHGVCIQIDLTHGHASVAIVLASSPRYKLHGGPFQHPPVRLHFSCSLSPCNNCWCSMHAMQLTCRIPRYALRALLASARQGRAACNSLCQGLPKTRTTYSNHVSTSCIENIGLGMSAVIPLPNPKCRGHPWRFAKKTCLQVLSRVERAPSTRWVDAHHPESIQDQ